MRQEIVDRIRLNRSYQIDKQFLVCLDNVLKKYKETVIYVLEISCKNVQYSFDSLDEFFEFTESLIKKIEKIHININFSDDTWKYDSSNIDMTFCNEIDSIYSGEIKFKFKDDRNYWVMKNEIEILLKNQKKDYSILSRIPLIACADIILYIMLCVYTGMKGIVFPKSMQNFISYTCIIIVPVSTMRCIRKMKRFLFPLNEICFGINLKEYNKAKEIRNFLGVTIIMAFIVGIIVNIVSNFII